MRHAVELDGGGAFRTAAGTERANEADIGPVFAAKVRLWWQPDRSGPWGALDADAFSTFGIGSTSGAIYDVQLATGYPVARGLDLVLGARLYGGGADLPSQDIYNWANFLSFTIGARATLHELLD